MIVSLVTANLENGSHSHQNHQSIEECHCMVLPLCTLFAEKYNGQWVFFFPRVAWHIKISIFDMPYLGKFWSNLKKIGTVVIVETRSLIWVTIIMISKVSLKNNLEFTFIWNNEWVHPLEMLRFSRNLTRMFFWS